jgi:hypothetical protein
VYQWDQRQTGYALITDEEKPNRHKMDPRAHEVKLVGYPEDVNGSYLVKTRDGRLLVRRDVKFNDFDFEKKLTEEEMKILYEKEAWNQYTFPRFEISNNLEKMELVKMKLQKMLTTTNE